MTHSEIVSALKFLGFKSNWVVQDDQITLWENNALQPTNKELNAALLKANIVNFEAKNAKAVARQAVLDKLGLTADEAAALFG